MEEGIRPWVPHPPPKPPKPTNRPECEQFPVHWGQGQVAGWTQNFLEGATANSHIQ